MNTPLYAWEQSVADLGLTPLDDGAPLSADWDPAEFFCDKFLSRGCLDDTTGYIPLPTVDILTGELVKWCHERLGSGKRQLDQHVLAWMIANWNDPRIPDWFRTPSFRAEVRVVVTGTIWKKIGLEAQFLPKKPNLHPMSQWRGLEVLSLESRDGRPIWTWLRLSGFSVHQDLHCLASSGGWGA